MIMYLFHVGFVHFSNGWMHLQASKEIADNDFKSIIISYYASCYSITSGLFLNLTVYKSFDELCI